MYANIVIVGGGTAGWFCAAYLKKKLPTHNITIIDASNEIATIGVGESTTPSFTKLLKELDVDIPAWINKANGTYKLGIRHHDWYKPGRILRSHFCSYYHKCLPGICQVDDYNTRKSVPCDINSYAFNIDANEIARECRIVFERLGGIVINDRILDVITTDDKQQITGVRTNKTGTIVGDYFVDCTGFKRLLYQALNRSYNKLPDLINDAALTYRGDLSSTYDLFTDTYALDFGWQWKIPLKNRTGMGIVYSSRFTKTEDVITYYRNTVPNFDDTRLNLIPFESFYSSEPFYKNLSGTGLSVAFIEPLEATSISTTIFLVRHIVDHIIGRSTTALNRLWRQYFINMYEFVIAHYTLSKREGAYWDYYRQPQFEKYTFKSVANSKKHDSFILGEFNHLMFTNMLYGYMEKC